MKHYIALTSLVFFTSACTLKQTASPYADELESHDNTDTKAAVVKLIGITDDLKSRIAVLEEKAGVAAIKIPQDKEPTKRMQEKKNIASIEKVLPCHCKGVVTATSVYLRESPTKNANFFDSWENGETLTITGLTKEEIPWYRVKMGQYTLWVDSRYVKITER